MLEFNMTKSGRISSSNKKESVHTISFLLLGLHSITGFSLYGDKWVWTSSLEKESEGYTHQVPQIHF